MIKWIKSLLTTVNTHALFSNKLRLNSGMFTREEGFIPPEHRWLAVLVMMLLLILFVLTVSCVRKFRKYCNKACCCDDGEPEVIEGPLNSSSVYSRNDSFSLTIVNRMSRYSPSSKPKYSGISPNNVSDAVAL